MFEKPAAPAPAKAETAAVQQQTPVKSAPAAAEKKAAAAKGMTPVVLAGAEASYTIQPVSGSVKKISFDKKVQKNAIVSWHQGAKKLSMFKSDSQTDLGK